MRFQPTDEQQAVIDGFKTGKDVTITAGAGCGKSATLEMLAESTDKRGLLIAFNRAVAEEASQKLSGTNTKALNTHRIAYAWARNDKQGSVVLDKMNSSKRISWFQVANDFNVKPFRFGTDRFPRTLDKKNVTQAALRALDNFFKDGSTEISSIHMPYIRGIEPNDVWGRGQVHKDLGSIVLPLAQRMWEDVLWDNGTSVRVTHDAYLKLWAMSRPVLPYDFILLDEAQDTNPAVMSVFENQQVQKVAVGDKNQQLYSFNGSINAMDKFESDVYVKLQKSWRFGTAIQDAANVFLNELEADIRLRGNPQVDSEIMLNAPFDPFSSSATLVRTNAGAINELIGSLSRNQSTHLIGGNSQFKNMIKAADQLHGGRTVTHPDFAGFSNWSEAREYANESDDGADLKVIVDLVENHGPKQLLSALDKCTEREDQAQTVISTVHKVKGREWDRVHLADDFISAKARKKDDGQLTAGSKESLMFYYVAVTRAKHILDPGPLFNKLEHLLGKRSDVPVEEPGNAVTLDLPEDLRERLDFERGEESLDSYILKLLE